MSSRLSVASPTAPVVIIWLGLFLPVTLAGEPPALLTEAAQVRRLTPIETERGCRARLTGVVTFSDPSRGLLFVQDATGGIFVSPQIKAWDWRVGEKVVVTGLAAQGTHLPYISQAVLQDLGPGNLPAAHPVTPAQLAGDTEDGNWVEIRGVVRSAVLKQGLLFLEIVAEGKRLRALFSDSPSTLDDLGDLVDAEVRLQGVCGMVFKETNNPFLLELHVPSLANLQVEIKAPEQPFLAPARSIASLRSEATAPALIHRIRVRGTLIITPDGAGRITDATGTAGVQPLPAVVVRSNSLAEVVGFPADAASMPILEDAIVHFMALSWPEAATSLTNATRENLPVLTEAQAVRRLPLSELQRGYPTRIRGVVTYVDPQWNLMFVQDETAGINVLDSPVTYRGKVGQLIDVEGFTGSGEFAPLIRQTRIQALGQGRLPNSKPVTLEQLTSGAEDGQRVEIPGIVRYVAVENGHLALKINTSGGLLKAVIPGFQSNGMPAYLVDAEVQARGVCGVLFNKERQLTGVQLCVAGLEDIQVTKPAPADPFTMPVRSINSLLRFHIQSGLRHRIHVRGTVTFRDPQWYTLFIQDEGDSLHVRTLQEPKLGIGDQVELVGFIVSEAFGPVMSEAIFRRIGPGKPPTAASVTVAQAVSGEYDAHLVSLEGRLVDRVRGITGPSLVLQGAEWTFLAALEATQNAGMLASIRKGSLLRLTGICSLEDHNNQGGTMMCLHMRSPSDVVVLEQPPWWTTRHWLALLGSVVVLLAATTAWIRLLRRNVREQTGVIRDKLEREAALEARYRELFENVNDLIQSLNPDGTIAYVNPAWLKAMGYKEAEVAKLALRDIIHPDDLPNVARALEQVTTGIHLNHVEARFRRKDGQVIEVEGSCSAAMKDGQPLAIRGIFRDVTERKQAETRLRQLSRAVEQSPVSIIITDIAGNIEYVNPKFTKTTGYDPGEVLGKNPRILKSGDKPSEAYRLLWKAITSGGEWQGEFYNRKKNGDLFWEHASISPIRDAGGVITHFLAVKEDITERKQLEDQIRQAQKMEAVGQLAGGVAHDFNNILAAILMQIGMLQEDPQLTPKVKGDLDELEKGAKRAANLTRQLLLFSRQQIMQLRPLNLNDVLADLHKMLNRIIGEHITLTFEGGTAPVWVEADAGMIEQVVINLCVNARDAMPTGGRLTIALKPLELDADSVRVNVDARPGKFACLSVTDTGCGMDEAVLKRIFEPFFTTKETGKGTGLGLATTFGIVKQHQGWIEVDSNLGKGATFRVYLPALGRSAPSPTASVPEAVVGGDESVLLVEDDVALRKMAALCLRRRGYGVFEAANGAEALRVWDQQRDRIKLLLTDMVMPGGMTGLDLAKRLRRETDSLRVIISSGYYAEVTKLDASMDPSITYLPKPYEIDTLAKVVRQCLDQA